LAMSFLLLVAGHETTVNLIASGTLTLIEQPEQLEELEADPQLIKPAVEELLRYTSPVEIATERYARHDLEVSDTEVPRGELVLAVLGSANHDEQYFDDPDALDLAPSQQAPRLRAGRRSPLPRGATGQDGGPDRYHCATPTLPRHKPGRDPRLSALAPRFVPARTGTTTRRILNYQFRIRK
jgi:hypothetical protein